MPIATGCVRVPNLMDARALDRECRAVWDNVVGETGLRTVHAKKIARLYMVCRDIQQAALEGARFSTVCAVFKLIKFVVEQSFGSPMERA